ncbi:transcriptional regulator [Streptomyces sp. VRA16 Mangrove soil]|uniref:ArsR/SmtB family transcription factor n=1 Tax=Streptomyces sp. VRA16 Mangrove soil TaxID=2817434 RepID=UPI001A9E240A|nr:helix-turn-helix domain-containing protein [Streptomyces sp. VRA16 Mangrove soil]MBO1337518.1 helix-turn-helix transcriptional regulator [Streptomyces sp. VRA16 Mangrove soil]
MNKPDKPSVRELDARSLRGLAHPLRMRLLDSLRFNGPATASQLAEKLGESSGATSYHLRQLAAHGFVEDDPERGKGRERWWKAVHRGLAVDNALLQDEDPEVRGAADFYLHEVAMSQMRNLSTWLGNRGAWPAEWTQVADLSSDTLRLTPELAQELSDRMWALIGEYRDLDAVRDDPRAETVRVHTHTFPLHTD